jgi:hypothetical protein
MPEGMEHEMTRIPSREHRADGAFLGELARIEPIWKDRRVPVRAQRQRIPNSRLSRATVAFSVALRDRYR